MRHGIWVFCEPMTAGIHGVSYELIGKARELDTTLNQGVTAVLLGSAVEKYAAYLCACGADQVLLVDSPALEMPEEMRYAQELSFLIQRETPSIVLIGATSFGRSLAPRIAARLGAGLTADCTKLEIDPDSDLLLQTRPAFGGNLLATIACPTARPQMATVRPKVFPCPAPSDNRPCRIVRAEPLGMPSPIQILEIIEGEQKVNIAECDVLVSVGQGIGGAQNIALAEALASKLNGALAASRPMVDAGLIPYARQVGQTGKAVAPKIYLALGISGAIQHLAGISAGTLIAVNTDSDAPIFEHADFGLTMDCGEFLTEMLSALE